MVKEFTELQGIVGGLYAKAQGEDDAVATAIYDHYKPVGMDDTIPRRLEGQIVSIADKLDTLKQCFNIGLVPTGSKDPLGASSRGSGHRENPLRSSAATPFDDADRGRPRTR